MLLSGGRLRCELFSIDKLSVCFIHLVLALIYLKASFPDKREQRLKSLGVSLKITWW